MGRTIARWVIAVVGVIAIAVGAAVAAGSAWVQSTLDSRDSLTSVPQRISASGCQTLLVEVSDAGVSAEDLEGFAPIADRSEETLSISVSDVPGGVLIGLADSGAVESRLLGARYCVAQAGSDGWSAEAVEPAADSPDVDFAGVSGLWARPASGEAVVVPLPGPGDTLVISADGPASVDEVQLVGRYRIVGAGEAATIALFGGIGTAVLGLLLLLVSVFGLRSRGRHEAGAAPSPEVAPPA